jgi:hypothetical protein
MLNAVKHLYRTTWTDVNGAAEMLHCVQHDPVLIPEQRRYFRPSQPSGLRLAELRHT